MKLVSEEREITRSGSFDEHEFSICASAQAFEILSGRIYTDPILAIVRELSTNAYDAQVDAGNREKPFDVHMPNSFEPHFSIRDYGTGIQPKETFGPDEDTSKAMEVLYRTYFQSTRGDSNEMVGALGLGSKSPFSYTDQFTVVTYWNGVAYTYSCFKGEKGNPTIAQLGKAETDEPNGLKVEISVNKHDIYKFTNAARSVYRWFHVRPNITGTEIEFPEENAILDRGDYRLYDREGRVPHRMQVVMGQVCYEVDPYKVTHKLHGAAKLVMFVEIGDCSISASREELYYDDRTVANLQALVDAATEDATQQFDAEIEGVPSKLDKILIRSKYSGLIQLEKDDASLARVQANDDGDLQYALRTVNVSNGKLLFKKRQEDTFRPQHGTRYIFVHDDSGKHSLPQKLKNRVRHWLESQEEGKYVAFICRIEDAAAFTETFGAVTVKATELPEVPIQRVYRDRTGVTPQYIKRLRDSEHGNLTLEWLPQDDEIDIEGAVAIPKDGYYVIWNGKQVRPNHVRKIARGLGFTAVYGITKSRYDKMRRAIGLPDLLEEAREYIEDFLQTVDKYSLARLMHNFGPHGYRNDICSRMLTAMVGASQTCNDVLALDRATDGRSWQRSIIETFDDLEIPETVDYIRVWKDRYPLIADMYLHDDEAAQHALHYIKLIEAEQSNV